MAEFDPTTARPETTGFDPTTAVPEEPPKARGFKGWAGDALGVAARGAISVPEAAVGLADIPTGGAVGKFLENEGGSFGFRPKQAKEAASQFFDSDATTAQNRQFQEADGIIDKAKVVAQNPSMIVRAVGESAPSMLAGGVAARGIQAATKVGPVLAGALGEGVVGAGSAAEQIRQETEDGRLTPTQSGLAAATGLATAGFGALGGKVANKLGIGDAETLLAQGAKGIAKADADAAARAAVNPLVQQQAVKSIPRQVIEGAIAEGFLEELPQSVAEQIFQNLALGKDWLKDVDGAAVMGVLTGGAMGAGASGYRAATRPTTTDADVQRTTDARVAGEKAAAAEESAGLARMRQAFNDQLNAASKTAPVLDETALQAAGVPRALPKPVLDMEQLDRGLADLPPSARMGLDPAAGPMSSAAALAVDTGVTDGLQQAAAAEAQQQQDGEQAKQAQAQADQQAAGMEKAAAAGRKAAVEGQRRIDLATGELLEPDTIQNWTDEQLANTFRGAQSKTVRLQMAKELSRRRTEALQRELADEQAAPEPTAPGLDAGFASVIEDAGPLTAEGNDGRPSPTNPGTQAAPARPAQSTAQAPAAGTGTADAGAAWTRTPTAEREALLARAEGLKPIQRKMLKRVAWSDMNSSIQKSLAAAMESPANQRPALDAQAPAAIKNEAPAADGAPRTITDKQGDSYNLTLKTEAFGAGNTKPNSLMVEVRDPATGDRRGFVDFAILPDGTIQAENAKVAPQFRRRGLSDAMYRAAAEAGYTIVPGRVQTEDGAGMLKAMQARGVVQQPAGAVEAAAADAAMSPENDRPEPTQAQREAGNYKKGHVVINGLDISIENPAGTRRRPEWPPLKDHYGYFKGTVGADKDHMDVFLTDRAEDTSLPVFVVDQNNKDGSLDEHKVIMGATDEANAREVYQRNYAKGWTGLGGIAQMTQDQFKAWVFDPTKTKQRAAAAPATEGAIVEHVTGRGKTLRGVVRTDLTQEQAKAIDEYTFKKGDGWFIREKYLENQAPALTSKAPEATKNIAPAPAPKPVTVTRSPGVTTMVIDPSVMRSPAPAPKAAPRPAPAPSATAPAERVVPANQREALEALEAGKVLVKNAGTEFEEDVWIVAESKGGVEGWVVKSREKGARATFTKGPVGPDRQWGWGKGDAARKAIEGMEFGAPAASAETAPAKPKVNPAQARAKADLMAALADLGDILGKNGRMNIVPEDEQKLLPVLTRLLDAAFRLGYHKFKDSAKFALDQIRANLGDEAADALTLDHLQGAYIGMAGGKKGADTKRAVIDVETKAEIEAHDAAAEDDATEAPAPAPEASEKERWLKSVADMNRMSGQFGAQIDGIANGRLSIVGNPNATKQGKALMSAVDEARRAGATTEEIAAAATGKATEAAKPTGATLRDALLAEITANRMPKDNPALKKLVEAYDGAAATPARMKEAQEALEAAIVLRAREAVAKLNREGPKTTFAALRRLYDSQPLLNVRTSTSIENQAYSTPAPLAYLASRLAGINSNKRVLEPTGGTGMLLIEANPDRAVVNELNPERAEFLRAQGFRVTEEDATKNLMAIGKVDSVITNPPFGSIKDADGKATKVKMDGYSLGQIDHLIAARALEAMKDDGRAVLILGANKVPGGISNDDLVFFNWLYSHYDVRGHFEIDGKLYQRQGAGWPVRVITIAGRKASKNVSPASGTVPRVDTWEEVYDQYERSMDASGPTDPRAAESAGRANGIEAERLTAPQPSSPAPAAAGGREPAGGAASAGTVAGAGPRAVGNRGERESAAVGAVPGQQRGVQPPAVAGRLDPERQRAGEPARAIAAGDPGNGGVADNEFQVAYVARSERKDAGVLIPRNMAEPTQAALNRLEDAVGSIDEFAAKELGYASTAALHNALMGLQIDSVASAIQQIKAGKGTIIADQTGIGKGRQAAAIIRWAVRNGKTPVFVTVKPSLFTDMFGDLADIGTDDVAPFIMNVDESIKGQGGERLFANKAPTHRRAIQQIAESGQLPDGRNAVFMTYSQINVANAQRTAIEALAPNAVFILDESHNAGGDSATGAFIRGVLDQGQGVTYLSATYAKRPDNMPVYFKTDIGEAVADDATLMEAMSAGGLPLQTVVANNLVKAGQMFRRERSYDGVNIANVTDTPKRAEHEKLSDAATSALREIVAADGMFHTIYVKERQKEAKEMGERMLDMAGNQASQSVNHTEFSSVVHNFVRQMLLGLKAQTAAEEAVASLKRGEKPLIAVENTMGSFLAEYAENNGIRPGAPLGNFDYRTVLSRALERTRYIVVQDTKGNKTKQYISLDELDGKTREAYDRAQAVIDRLDIDIPVSPIDWMRNHITKAGYSVAEITGRNLAVDYSGKRPLLSAIDQQEQRDKVETTRRFNDGRLDAVILNVAGSTGISLHASEKFADRRQRHMIVAQPAQDINIFMQMLGRIHRTGQVALPKYTILGVDLPAEKRPMALTADKMKSLNANTSSNTESATSVQAVSLLNKYGDQVVAQYLDSNLELARALGIDTPLDSEGNATEEDMARKATGRLALMPVKVQQDFYDEVEDQYRNLINYLNETNQNDLEPRTFDFDAKETSSQVLFEGENPTTPFGEDAIYGEYSIKAQGKPMTPAEIKASIAEHLDGKTFQQHAQALMDRLDPDLERYLLKLDDAGKEQALNQARATRQYIADHAIGAMFRVQVSEETYNAVVTNIRSTHKSNGNPYAASKLQITIALNGSLRSLTVPATQFKMIEVSAMGRRYSIDSTFQQGLQSERETAKIITGNLLAAYGELKGVRGTIISFTKSDGTSDQGILLPKGFNVKANTQGDYRFRTGAEAYAFLMNSTDKNIDKLGISTRDQAVRVVPVGAAVTIRVPKSKARGAKFFLDKRLIDAAGADFVSTATTMNVTVPAERAAQALDVLADKQALYALPSMSEEAKAMADAAKPESPAEDFAAAPAARTGTPADRAVMGLAQAGAKAQDILNLIAGTSRNLNNRRLAQALVKAGIEPRVTMGGDLGGRGDDFKYIAKYTHSSDTITMTPLAASHAEQVFLHEAVHAATVHALNKRGLASIQMNRLFKHVEGTGAAAQQYGMTNVREFVAEAFSNPEFQAALKSMPAPRGSTLRTAWDEFVRIVRNFLGLTTDPTPGNSVLDEVMRAGAALMRENAAATGRGDAGADISFAEAADGDVSYFGTKDMAALKNSALAQIDQAMNAPGQVSVWDKTVGTMRNLAERNPAFKPVFESAQQFIDDVAMLAADAADAGPRLMPRIDTLRDLAKKPVSAEDNAGVARPLFEGTLLWGRDVDGKAVRVDDLQAKYGNLPASEKAQQLLRAGRIDPGVLRMWQGLPVEQFENLINSQFNSKMLKPGVLWSEKELKEIFDATDTQVSLYQEARKAIDRSLDMTTRADMLRLLGKDFADMRDVVLDAPTLADARDLLTNELQQQARENPEDADRLMDLNNAVVDRYEKIADLIAHGYAPLSRFGRYTVDVVGKDGTREYFGMFETPREANKMAERMRAEFRDAAVTQGTMSEQSYKLFQGITPESLEMFGNMLGLNAGESEAQDKAFQAYLQLTKNNQSALKRLIHRKGIAGYSEDVGRVLANFTYSNARLGAGALNAGRMEQAIQGIPKEHGQLRDVAIGLREYISDPQEEGQAIRGMLFAQYLGGSIASAFVNTTQPFAVTMPWLSQFGGMRKAAGQLSRAMRDMGTKGFRYEPDLGNALHHAEADGIVSPQEIHQLMAQARGAGTLTSGDGTRLGNARAAASNTWERTKVLWGQPFALAEQFNRRSTFIAAYRLAKEQKLGDPAAFARKAVLETQFLYSKANKPRWARGAVGGTLMTFKTYSISYLELLNRTWNAGAPGSPQRAAGRRAVAWSMAMLMLMGGGGGLPFVEDLEDLIDGIGQLMGYNISSKQWRKKAIQDVVGKELGEFLDNGLSGLPGAPIDVSGRLGMGNLIPGTGLFLTKPSRERDLLEVAGPAGDLVARGFGAARKVLTGDVGGAALEVAPTAVRNAAKGVDMATSGIYKDTKGYKVIDTTLDEALAKAIGFQPRSVAQVQESNSFMQRSKSFYTQTSAEIKAQWADALFNQDEAALERVRARLESWNKNNPDQRIVVKMPDVWKRVREMGKDRTQRIAETAPKALRQQMQEMARESS